MSDGKQRHGCLTTWLVLMIISYVFTIAAMLGFKALLTAMGKPMPNQPAWLLPATIVLCLLGLVCVIGLFKWKKWGFYGYVALGVVSAVLHVMQGRALLGIIGVIISIVLLYLVLQIGKENKGWTQLE